MTEGPTGQIIALADLAVRVAANVAQGQVVVVRACLVDAPLVHAIARAAYRCGAHQVDVDWIDPELRRVRLKEAEDAALGSVPPWVHTLPAQLAEIHGAAIRLAGNPAPGLLDDVDAGRVGRDAAGVPGWRAAYSERSINWTAMPSPTREWAGLVYPELNADAAYERLWSDIARICRLDEPDPGAAWRARISELSHLAEQITAAQLDSLHFQGDGTDLRVGLLPGTRWGGGGPTVTTWGREHLSNLPTEEVFTSPDPQRTEGIVRSTTPLLIDGRAINGLRIRFEHGRAVQIDADSGAELLRELCSRDDGASRLGEVALVDASGRIGPLNTIFHHSLLDENAASHLALGAGFPFVCDDAQARAQINQSAIHTDFMIGGPGVRVSGRTRDGRDVDVLGSDGAWHLF